MEEKKDTVFPAFLLLDGGDREEGERLAARLGIPLAEAEAETGETPDESGLRLRLTADRLYLEADRQSACCDFTKMLRRIHPSRLGGEMVVKAARIRGAAGPLRVLDGTAGLGEDSFLLAAAGFQVTLIERDPVIYALLADGIRRARAAGQDPEAAEDPAGREAREEEALAEAAGRMTAVEGDSIQIMRSLAGREDRPDVILLDPMFPERKKSGLVKKKFQLIHQLENPEENERALVEAALTAQPRKIIIKRPAKGPFLGGVKPNHQFIGKTIRYDCLVPGPRSHV